MSLTKVTYSMIAGGIVNANDYGFSSTATAADNYAALVAALASGASTVEVRIPGNYSLDNTTPIVLSTTGLTFTLAAGVNILPTVNTKMVFQITGVGITFQGGTITGDGTYPIDVANPTPDSPAGYYLAANTTAATAATYATGRPVSFIEINGYGLTQRQNAIVRNVTIVNPNCAGITLYYTVGSECFGNRITSNYSGSFVAGFFLTSLYSCAYVSVENNYLYGHVEGVLGGSTPSNTFNDYVIPTALSNTRHITISNNVIANQIDHGIYISNDADHTTVIGNNITNAISGSGHAIKAYGSCNVVGNTTSTQRAAFNGRNTHNSTITGNNFEVNVVSGVSSNNAVIYADCTAVVSEPLQNITISGNTCIVAGRSPNGIYLFANKSPVDGTQQIIKNITIAGNTISGNIGATSAEDPFSSGIKILQEAPTSGGNSYAENITISGNTINTIATGVYRMQFGVLLSGLVGYLGYDGVNISGNSFNNFYSTGINGNFKNSLISENIFKPIVAALGLKEVTNVDTPSGSNIYGTMLHTNDAGYYNLESESSIVNGADLNQYTDSNMTSNYTFLAARPYRNLVLSPTASRTVTISGSSGAYFQIGFIVTVHNYSAANNVDFGGVATVAPSTSKTFMCTGSNTFIQIY